MSHLQLNMHGPGPHPAAASNLMAGIVSSAQPRLSSQVTFPIPVSCQVIIAPSLVLQPRPPSSPTQMSPAVTRCTLGAVMQTLGGEGFQHSPTAASTSRVRATHTDMPGKEINTYALNSPAQTSPGNHKKSRECINALSLFVGP